MSKTKTQTKKASKKTAQPKAAKPEAPKSGRELLRDRLAARGFTPTFPLVTDPTILKEAEKDVPEVQAYGWLIGELESCAAVARKGGHALHVQVAERTLAVARNARAQLLGRYLRAEGLA